LHACASHACTQRNPLQLTSRRSVRRGASWWRRPSRSQAHAALCCESAWPENVAQSTGWAYSFLSQRLTAHASSQRRYQHRHRRPVSQGGGFGTSFRIAQLIPSQGLRLYSLLKPFPRLMNTHTPRVIQKHTQSSPCSQLPPVHAVLHGQRALLLLCHARRPLRRRDDLFDNLQGALEVAVPQLHLDPLTPHLRQIVHVLVAGLRDGGRGRKKAGGCSTNNDTCDQQTQTPDREVRESPVTREETLHL
jgi:hypothetical protein